MKLKAVHVFLLGIGGYGLWFYAQLSQPVIPSPPPGGTVPVKLGNAGPSMMNILITNAAGQVYRVKIPPCPTCLEEIVMPPPETKCPVDTVYQTFTLNPERYKVDLIGADGTITYSSPLDLSNGKAFDQGTCFFQLRVPPQHRNLQDKA